MAKWTRRPWRPVPSKEFVDSAGRVIGDALNDVSKIGLRVDAVHFAGFDDGIDDRCAIAERPHVDTLDVVPDPEATGSASGLIATNSAMDIHGGLNAAVHAGHHQDLARQESTVIQSRTVCRLDQFAAVLLLGSHGFAHGQAGGRPGAGTGGGHLLVHGSR
jgi:hypothetical protein